MLYTLRALTAIFASAEGFRRDFPFGDMMESRGDPWSSTRFTSSETKSRTCFGPKVRSSLPSEAGNRIGDQDRDDVALLALTLALRIPLRPATRTLTSLVSRFGQPPGGPLATNGCLKIMTQPARAINAYSVGATTHSWFRVMSFAKLSFFLPSMIPCAGSLGWAVSFTIG